MTRTSTQGQLTLPGQAAAPDGPVDLTPMFLMHHAFRRDLTAFAGAVRGTPVADRETWRALDLRWRRFAEVLHHHHSGEDHYIWPELIRAVDRGGSPEDRATLEAMEAEHADIDPMLEACARGFATLAQRRTRRSAPRSGRT
ncbi:hemerythrin domain-containing protein [Blastococcus brunescens]|uniref:Hemerythrin domain-containing protein n=1 Tax=Blastococcus brunescens TaxID=1564165 RepID=A0ABZ1AUY7_9ACTN|nr:hemerythrin domain-containing protein [Blastococcus sp. BMG 8361]WRL62315.1 hemerythrin domain-containing protein [Blastococcus sp. BMG 8361]